MGIRFYCPNGHKMNVKEFQAGRRGICPQCGAKVVIPVKSTRKSSKELRGEREAAEAAQPGPPPAGPGNQTPSPAIAPPTAPPGSQPAEPPAAPDAQNPPAAVPIPIPAPNAMDATAPYEPSAPEPSPAPQPAADPLGEAGDVVWYVRPPSGGQFGPAASNIMRGWIEEGRVSADSLVWREGWRDWQEASNVFPQLGAARVEPLPGGPAIGASPVPTAPPTAPRPRSRRPAKGNQTSIIAALILAVILLLGVFIWVLIREPAAQPNSNHNGPSTTVPRKHDEDPTVSGTPRRCVQSVCG